MVGGNFLSDLGKMGESPPVKKRDSAFADALKADDLDAGNNTLSLNMEEGSAGTAAIRHGFEASVQFKPVEHPTESLVHDQAITCPLSEPSILNDGRIWQERRTSASAYATTNLPVVRDGSHFESRDGQVEPPPDPAENPGSSSVSVPDHKSVTLSKKKKQYI